MIVLLFLTDGTANYPSSSLMKFKNDMGLMSKVDFDAIGFPMDPGSIVE
jgi:hypothetical protein